MISSNTLSKPVLRHTRTQTQCLDIGASISIQVNEIVESIVKPSVNSESQTEAREDTSDIMIVEVMDLQSDYDTDSIRKGSLLEDLAIDAITAAADSIAEEDTLSINSDSSNTAKNPAPRHSLIQASPDVSNEQSTQAGSHAELVDASSQQETIPLETQGSQTPPAAVQFHESVQSSNDIALVTDSQTMTDTIEEGNELEQVFDKVTVECSSLSDECSRLRSLLITEKKKRQHIAEENAILRYRYVVISFLIFF